MCRMIALVLVTASTATRAGTLEVVSTSPQRNTLASKHSLISVTFDRAIDQATVDASSFRVFGRWSGAHAGSFNFSNGDQTVTFDSSIPFSAGEPVFVNLADTLVAADATPIRPAGFAFQFRTVAQPATRQFIEIDSFSNRTEPGTSTRIYGAAGSDLNHDGFLDLTTVNEDAHDLRVFLNSADGSGLFDDFLTPFPIGIEASPNEPADFNNDGHVDIAVAASSSGSVWICLGNGDGTFGSSQEVAVDDNPHGLVVLDADGDGDADIATTNSTGNNVALLINNGAGVFAPAVHFEGGGDGEYALGAADMNNDGITDLVVGARSSQQIIIHLGNGDATFTQASTQAAGGNVWMIALGDVNGDGWIDVSTANSVSNSGSILLNDATGELDPPNVMPNVASHIVATDLGDLDGDGDLDWVLSSFGSGQWDVFTNDGQGNYTFDQQFDAPSNSSCAIILDIDNDADLDLVLTDEIADVVIVLQNQNPEGAGVPAASTWSVVVMALVLVTLGTRLFGYQRRVT